MGVCTQRPVVRKKQVGQACSQSGRVDDYAAGNCNCTVVNNMTGNGFCTTSCIVGGTVNLCPAGWVCDNQQSNVLPDGTMITSENNDTQGVCVPTCSSADGGTPAESGVSESGVQDGASEGSTGTSDASGGGVEASAPAGCPAGSTCQVFTPLGLECWP
jgi:hypothetical protein